MKFKNRFNTYNSIPCSTWQGSQSQTPRFLLYVVTFLVAPSLCFLDAFLRGRCTIFQPRPGLSPFQLSTTTLSVLPDTCCSVLRCPWVRRQNSAPIRKLRNSKQWHSSGFQHGLLSLTYLFFRILVKSSADSPLKTPGAVFGSFSV